MKNITYYLSKIKLFLPLFFILILVNSTYSQNINNWDEAQNYIDKRGEVYFYFINTDNNLTKDISKYISIDNIKNDTVFAYSNQQGLDKIKEFNLNINVLTPPSLLHEVEMGRKDRQTSSWDYYPTYTEYEEIMSDFANNYPNICKLLVIDTLNSGRKLIGVKISDNVNLAENEPEFLYSATIHGDETTGYILMMRLIDYLLSNYSTDTRIANMVNNIEIVIFPLANPDGTYRSGNHTVNGATRYNANNVDLNRNYPDPKDGPHPDGKPWQEETIAFMNFATANNFVLGGNFHGGAEVINYPWDTWSRLTADDNWWVLISREYADTVHANAPSNYLSDFNNGITNGYQWYSINGGRQDYMNYFQNCREYTLEISNVKLLPTSQLNNHWNYNYRSFLNNIEQSLYGLHGVVTDSISGEPIKAKVQISNHDIDNSFVFSSANVGDYHRMLKSGNYNVTFSAEGYVSKSFNVSITDFATTVLDVQLYNGALLANFTSDTTETYIDGSINFVNKSLGSPESVKWFFEGGNPEVSTELNPTVVYDTEGEFDVKLVIYKNNFLTDTLFIENFVKVNPWYIINNKQYEICQGKFFDSGGPLSNYQNNEDSKITFTSNMPNHHIAAKFIALDIEGNIECNDKLIVYDGPNVTYPIIATICGNTLPEDIISSNTNQSLTFQFISDNINEKQGWEIDLYCIDFSNSADINNNDVFIYPNPIDKDYFIIKSSEKVNSVTCYDALGRFVFGTKKIVNDNTVFHNLSNGMYFIKIETEKGNFSKKIIINR